MRQRVKRDCNAKEYRDRGITICSEWDNFAMFLSDMGPRPTGTSLDRIDNDGNYEPGNCRWATRTEQMRNTRRSKLVTIGPLAMCISAWAEESGKSQYEIRRALLRGENSAQAVYG